MSHCVQLQVIVDHPQGRRERHPPSLTLVTDRESVFVSLCVINCQEELLAARGSGPNSVVFNGSSFSPLFTALASICQHVGSQVQLPLVWVKIHPLRTASRACSGTFCHYGTFVTKVTKRAAMPACFVTNKVVTNRAGIAPFFSHLDISTCVTCVWVGVCMCARACVKERERERVTQRGRRNECVRQNEREKGEGERHTGKNKREKEKRETEKKVRERAIAREREWGRARKNMLGTYYAPKCTRRCMEWNITPKVSPHLSFISSNHTSHSIKQGHPQHTIKPHFHSVSISIVIFHTAHRATGSSSLVVYPKQYRISV